MKNAQLQNLAAVATKTSRRQTVDAILDAFHSLAAVATNALNAGESSYALISLALLA